MMSTHHLDHTYHDKYHPDHTDHEHHHNLDHTYHDECQHHLDHNCHDEHPTNTMGSVKGFSLNRCLRLLSGSIEHLVPVKIALEELS